MCSYLVMACYTHAIAKCYLFVYSIASIELLLLQSFSGSTSFAYEELMRKSIKELRFITKTKDVDISNCLEKSEIVNIIYSSSRKQCRDVAETVNKTIQCIVIETDSSESSKEYKVPSDLDSLSAESCDSDDRNCKMNKRAIDGLVAYRLTFNPKNMMRSSKDGRSWGTWVTSNRKGFDRKRRTARCNGGYKCENLKCSFLTVYKVNKLQFESDGNGIKSCSCCGEQATKVHCNSQKIWEFEKNEEYITVYHLGNHNCEVKKTVELNKESLK